MSNSSVLRQELLALVSRLDMQDMSVQKNAINRAFYELLRDNKFIRMESVATLANKYYSGTNARYGKIVENRITRHFGGDSKTAGTNEINNILSSSGWRLTLNQTTCKAKNSKTGALVDLNEI